MAAEVSSAPAARRPSLLAPGASTLSFGVYDNNILLFNQEQFPYPQASQGYVLFGKE